MNQHRDIYIPYVLMFTLFSILPTTDFSTDITINANIRILIYLAVTIGLVVWAFCESKRKRTAPSTQETSVAERLRKFILSNLAVFALVNIYWICKMQLLDIPIQPKESASIFGLLIGIGVVVVCYGIYHLARSIDLIGNKSAMV